MVISRLFIFVALSLLLIPAIFSASEPEIAVAKWMSFDDIELPPPRQGGCMVYDPNRDRVVLFGGVDQQERLTDLWEWDGVNWTLIEYEGEGPGGCYDGAMVYDSDRERLVAHQIGIDSDDGGIGFLQSWTWNGDSWEVIDGSGRRKMDGSTSRRTALQPGRSVRTTNFSMIQLASKSCYLEE